MTENLIIFNARVVTPIGFSARCGKEMGDLCIIDNATIEVTDGIISYVALPGARCVTDIINATGTTMLVANACYPASSIRIPTLYLVANVPKSSPGD